MSRTYNPESGFNGNFLKPKDKPKTEVDLKPLEELEEFFDKYIQPNIDKNQIDEEEFEDIYPKEEIAEDLEVVESHKAIFERAIRESELTEEQDDLRDKLNILAKEFEAICSDHTILSRGLGMRRGEVKAQSASDYDDIMNKMDIFLEFSGMKQPGSEIGDFSVGIDVTISKDSFAKKFADLYRIFRKYPLAKAKYFRESADGITDARLPVNGEVSIPRYIINAHPNEMMQLMEGWKNWRDNFKPVASTKEKTELLEKTKLTKSHLWYRMIYQLERQAYQFAKIFKESNPKAAEMYRKNYMIFTKIRYNLTLKYIRGDEGWSNRLMDIQREKNEDDKQIRFDHLRKDVHDQFRGEDMGYIMRIVTDQVNEKRVD